MERPGQMLSQVNPTRICLAVVAVYAYILYRQYGNGGWLFDSAGLAQSVDFIGVWAAGHVALKGMPMAAYDAQLHGLAHAAAIGQATKDYYPFPYPPFHLSVAATLALLPYIPALLMWTATTFVAYLWTAGRILGTPRGALWMAAPPAVLANVIVGQNGFYSATLLGLGLLKLEQRPWVAGIFLGLLAYKPQLAVLVPVALAAGGYWRAFVSAGATAVALVVLSLAIHGPETWLAFIAQVGAVGKLVSQQGIDVGKLQSLFGILRQLGVAPQFAMAAQVVLALGLTAGIALLWRRPVPFALKAAALGGAALMVSPYLFVYDLSVLMVAQAFLLRFAIEKGVEEADLWGLVAANVAICAVAFTGQPIGLLGCLVVLGLVWRRVAAGEGWRPRLAIA